MRSTGSRAGRRSTSSPETSSTHATVDDAHRRVPRARRLPARPVRGLRPLAALRGARRRCRARRAASIRYRLHPGQFSVTSARAPGAGLSLRPGGGASRAGAASPTRSTASSGSTRRVCERLGVSQAELDETVVSDAVQWAATLTRVGREDGGGGAARRGGRGPGAPARADARAAARGAPAEACRAAWPLRESRTGARRRARAADDASVLQVTTSDRGGGAEAVALALHRALSRARARSVARRRAGARTASRAWSRSAEHTVPARARAP